VRARPCAAPNRAREAVAFRRPPRLGRSERFAVAVLCGCGRAAVAVLCGYSYASAIARFTRHTPSFAVSAVAVLCGSGAVAPRPKQ